MSDLLEMSQKHKQVGLKLLEETDLLSILGEYGDTKIVGSFEANLLYEPDIDIQTEVESFSRDRLLDAFKKIYELDYFDSYYIGDWHNSTWRDNMPDGYYLGFKKKLPESRWKIDIWFVTPDEVAKRSGRLDITKFDLNDDQRRIILDFKKYNREHKLGLESVDVYDAVLNRHATDPEKLRDYLK